MIDINIPLDLTHPEADEFLDGIQGNIIKGHGRNFSAHLIIKIAAGAPDARKWISRFATDRVTTAAVARQQSLNWREEQGPGAPFFMILLAPDGYRRLGFSDDQLPNPRNDQFTAPFHERYFRLGMKRQSTIAERSYNDPPPAAWETAYQQEIHAMVLLADDDEDRLSQTVADVTASFAGTFEVLAIERGRVLIDKFSRGTLGIEHFGFQDGISQPVLIQQDVADEISKRGADFWDPSAGLGLALVEEPGGSGAYGSFMVFRKLEQNVEGFWVALGDLAEKLGANIEDVGAMAVGRYRDGTPAVPTTGIDLTADPNDFNFDQDALGARCPFHAHIRKTNPRGDIARIVGAPFEFERARRVVRRGIPYGERPNLQERPTSGVGLLFMCFQSNLDQFVIQQEGSDSNDFVRQATGIDAVIGQSAAPSEQTWPSNGAVKFTMANFVAMKGGEYFFAPSLSFLKSLSP